MEGMRTRRAILELRYVGAVMGALLMALQPAAGAYSVSSGGFADGSDSASLVFFPLTTELAGPSIHLLTNSTPTGGSIVVAGRSGYFNNTWTDSTTQDFLGGREASNLSIAGGSMLLEIDSTVVRFDASNEFGNATLDGLHDNGGYIELNGSLTGTMVTETIAVPPSGWGMMLVSAGVEANETILVDFLAPNGTRVLSNATSGASIPLDPVAYPALRVKVFLSAPSLSQSPSLQWITLGQRTGYTSFQGAAAVTEGGFVREDSYTRTIATTLTSFSKWPGNPLIASTAWSNYEHASNPNIVLANGTYHLFSTLMGSSGYAIGHARSADLSNWTWDANPVLLPQNGTWEDRVMHPWVVSDPDGSGFLMYYTGMNGTGLTNRTYRAGLATSNDLENWTKHGGNPILGPTPGEWDSSNAGRPIVEYRGGGFRMWYAGNSVPNNIYAQASVGYATSPDGLNWTKYTGNPILNYSNYPEGIQGLQATSVREFMDQLVMVLSCTRNTSNLCIATSSDGLNWSVQSAPILRPSSYGNWDDVSLSGADTLELGEKIVLIYSGYGGLGETRRIGRADPDFVKGTLDISLDLGSRRPASYWTVSFDLNAPAGSTYTLRMGSSADGANWSAFSTVTSGVAAAVNGERYVRWQFEMNATPGSSTPTFSGFSVLTESHVTGGRYVSAVRGGQDDVVAASVTAIGDLINGSVGLHISNDNGSTWSDVQNGSLEGLPQPGSDFLYAIDFESIPSRSPVIAMVELVLQKSGFPENVTLRLGSTGVPFFNRSGALDGAFNVSIPAGAMAQVIVEALNQTPSATSVDSPFIATSSRFGVVELRELRIAYELKSPLLTSFTPSATTFALAENTTVAFAVNASSYPATVPINISWFLDDAELASHRGSDTFDFSPDYFAAGNHTIRCSVENGDILNSKTWYVEVLNVNRAPVLTRIAPAQGALVSHAQTTTFAVLATDLDGEPLAYVWRLDGVLLGTQSNATMVTGLRPGNHSITVEVRDPWTAATLQWAITSMNSVPVVATMDPAPVFRISHAATETFLVGAFDADGEPLQYAWSLDGVALSGTSGASVVLGELSIGFHVLRAEISDAYASAVATWNLTSTNDPPRTVFVNPVADRNVSHTSSVSFSITVMDADGDPIEIRWSVDGVPRADNTSSFAWGPVGLGRHTVAVELNDGFESSIHVWNITGTNAAPVITLAEPAGPTTVSYVDEMRLSVVATDPDGDPVFFNWTLGIVPLSGPGPDVTIGPLEVGSYQVRVNASDGLAHAQYVFAVVSVDRPPVIESADPVGGTVSSYLDTPAFSVRATDYEEGTLRFRWELDNESVAGQFNRTELGGVSEGSHQLRVIVSDAETSVSWLWFFMTTNSPPTVVDSSPSASHVEAPVGTDISFSIQAVDPDGEDPTYRWTRDNAPWGATNALVTNWSQPGEHVVMAVISTPGHMVTVSWNVTVTAENEPARIEWVLPSHPELRLPSGSEAVFAVSIVDDGLFDVQLEWLVDGELQGRGTGFVYSAPEGGGTQHEVILIVKDGDSEVASTSWIVHVIDSEQPGRGSTSDFVAAALGLALGIAVGALIAYFVLARRRPSGRT